MLHILSHYMEPCPIPTQYARDPSVLIDNCSQVRRDKTRQCYGLPKMSEDLYNIVMVSH